MPNRTKKPKIDDLQEQIANLTDALLRERADATNIRRRHEEQITSLRNSVKSGVIEELLPIIDNFERAIKHVPDDLVDNDYIKGVNSIVKQFEKTLADIGVTKIPTIGHHFDPHLHEAVSMEEGKGDNEIISEEIQSGFLLGDRVIRHAMVRVKKSK